MLYEIPDHVKNNIIEFLNRTPFQGFKEHAALTEILEVLSKPIQEDVEKDIDKQKD